MINTKIARITVVLIGLLLPLQAVATQTRPNIVHIALEDITPLMGCYGDKYAKTPTFDQLAAEGIRYTHAYSVGPVCSVSRSSIVTGMYPSTIGTHHHRSNVGRPPAFLEMVPNLMAKAGYFTANKKGDYNINGPRWQAKADGPVWRKRKDPNQPFYVKYDFGECHSSITKIPEGSIVRQRLNRLKPEDFHDPAKVVIPPYHPDTPMFRKAWSRYYDSVTQVDYRAAEVIAWLKEDGLWDDTIIIVWADHGVGMPRGKHTVWEQGTHVPLIVRYPKKYQHLAPFDETPSSAEATAGKQGGPAKPGSVLDDLVCLMDLGPSDLKLAGIETPDYMRGRALLCKSDAKKRNFVVSGRDRLDSRFEMVRSVRDKRYRYQRNFYPNLPFAPYEDFQFQASVYAAWMELARAGKLEGDQVEYALRFKPVEQLFDSEKDPHMIKDVAGDPAYAEVLETMRGRLNDWMIETRDLGVLEETLLHQRAKGKSSHGEVGHEMDDAAYTRILETANLQTEGEKAVGELTKRCDDPDPAVRFWAVLGLVVVTQTADAETVDGIVPTLKKMLADGSVSVRLSAADGLCNLGHWRDAAPALSKALADPMIAARIRASGILDTQPPQASLELQEVLENLHAAKAKTNVRGMPGIPYGLNDPFGRAYKALSGQASYYRWGMGASGSPESPLMKVQEEPFVPAKKPPANKSAPPSAKGKPSTLKATGGQPLASIGNLDVIIAQIERS